MSLRLGSLLHLVRVFLYLLAGGFISENYRRRSLEVKDQKEIKFKHNVKITVS